MSLFVGCDGRTWSESEIAGRLKALLVAARWLVRQAAHWRAPVRLGVCDTYFAVDDSSAEPIEIGFSAANDEIVPVEVHAEYHALVLMSRCAKLLGVHDGVELVEQMSARMPNTHIAWLVHLRRAGQSLAIPLDLSALPGVALAVCHAREANFTRPVARIPVADPVTFAHELLHLFGASDKYGVPLRRFPRGSVTDQDVMRLDRNRLPQLRIDPLTAEEIGWNGNEPGEDPQPAEIATRKKEP
jgi:hypothetical protein